MGFGNLEIFKSHDDSLDEEKPLSKEALLAFTRMQSYMMLHYVNARMAESGNLNKKQEYGIEWVNKYGKLFEKFRKKLLVENPDLIEDYLTRADPVSRDVEKRMMAEVYSDKDHGRVEAYLDSRRLAA